jgi:hypothetical protein
MIGDAAMQFPLFAAGVGQLIFLIIIIVFYIVRALSSVGAKKDNDTEAQQEPEKQVRTATYNRKQRSRRTKQEPILTIEDDIEGPTNMLTNLSSTIKTSMPSDSVSANTYVQTDGIGNFSYDTIDHNAAYDTVNPAIATAFANEIVQLLSSPVTVRQAVIMSEVLNKPLGLEKWQDNKK